MLRLRSTTELRRLGAIFGSGRERGRQRMGKVLAMVFHNEHSRHRILRSIIITKSEYWVLEYRYLRPKRTNPLDRTSETSKFQIPEDLNILNQDFGSGSEFRISGSRSEFRISRYPDPYLAIPIEDAFRRDVKILREKILCW